MLARRNGRLAQRSFRALSRLVREEFVKPCPQHDNDIQLMLRIKHGDRQAFDELQGKYEPIVRNVLVNLGCPEDLLDDLRQEVFTRVWEHRQRYQPDSAVKTFLFGIARNVWRQQQHLIHCRDTAHRQWARVSTPYDHSSEPEVVIERRRLAETLGKTKSRLSDKRRQAVELIFESGLSHTEAAKQAGCSENALYQCLYKAKSQMSEMLREFQTP